MVYLFKMGGFSMAMLNNQMVIEDKGMEQTITNTVHKLWTITIFDG